jgi:hypothetical protein
MTEAFIKNPTEVWMQYLDVGYGRKLKGHALFDYGRVAMGLEIVTKIKMLESLPVTTEYGRQEAISALHTILVEQGLAESIYALYDELNDWRKPKFRPSSQQLGLSRAATSDADDSWPQRQRLEPSSADATQPSEQPPPGWPGEREPGRPSRGGDAHSTSSSGGEPPSAS